MITPVLLCGGTGTRLWPLSRKSYPKQFVPLTADETLFQASAGRFAGEGFGPPVVVTNVDFRFIVKEQLAELGIEPAAILLEPEGRNTGPAVLAAALYLQGRDTDGIMLVAPSDHVVPNVPAFHAAVRAALPGARDGALVTFGVTPTHAETGYGYLELGEMPAPGRARPLALSRFTEKPAAAEAERMVDDGTYLWNSGMVLASARGMVNAFRTHAPDLMGPVVAGLDRVKADLGFLRLDPAAWREAPTISLDYAVLEKAANVKVVPFADRWSDLGAWDAVWREAPRDADGVATRGPATAIDCEDTLLRSEDDRLEIVGLGLKGVIAVAMPDAVLVADASRAQEVDKAVARLKARKVAQAETFPKDHRPWGWFESLVIGDRFQVKRIHVHPGAALSLQSHHHRAEHWIVVSGTAKVTVDDMVKLVSENESVFIPLGAVHRMENPGKVPMVLIEVQTGAYLGEDDIVRYEDVYARA
ncbi:mannose-1-phosphate guanylyltransferase/mannose-6-phosphate isomerase [Pseudooceanicola sp. LIPI14-2-Ac024]|uniref:mannose-1-phosphate guanylyltransferase/mannose-6-phosphate isomerase n=1 Tax=Pseudooceanicola sp. LIPI14-2-Ac024 TaxID=3344875 RepID=UPI0035CEE479